MRAHKTRVRSGRYRQAMSSAVDPAVSTLSRRLLAETDDLGAAMAARIREEIGLYAAGEVVTDEQLISSCRDNTAYVLGQLAGEEVSSDIPRATGAVRAEQGVPYAEVLQAFRVGGRFIWELLVERADPEARDVLLLAAADIWAVSDGLAAQVTDAYRAALADLARRDAQRRAVLVGRLLDGDAEADPTPGDSADALGLGRTGEFVVVTAECPAPGVEALPDAEVLLRRHNVASAWRLDHHFHEGLVVLRHGFTVPQLLDLLGPAARTRIGVSTPFGRVHNAPEGRREARLAAAAVTPGTSAVLSYEQDAVAVLLAGSPESTQALVRRVLGPVLELPHDDCHLVLDTARAWLQAAGSTSTAARQLHLHRNTVRYRLRRLEELTGRDLTHPVQATELYLALEGVRILDLA